MKTTAIRVGSAIAGIATLASALLIAAPAFASYNNYPSQSGYGYSNPQQQQTSSPCTNRFSMTCIDQTWSWLDDQSNSYNQNQYQDSYDTGYSNQYQNSYYGNQYNNNNYYGYTTTYPYDGYSNYGSSDNGYDDQYGNSYDNQYGDQYNTTPYYEYENQYVATPNYQAYNYNYNYSY
jgi:hypothetical protein